MNWEQLDQHYITHTSAELHDCITDSLIMKYNVKSKTRLTVWKAVYKIHVVNNNNINYFKFTCTQVNINVNLKFLSWLLISNGSILSGRRTVTGILQNQKQ